LQAELTSEQSHLINFQLTANSATANSSSSSVFVVDYAALRALQAGEEKSSLDEEDSSSDEEESSSDEEESSSDGEQSSSDGEESLSDEEESSSDEEDDIFIPNDHKDDEDDDFMQDTIHRYLLRQLDASEAATMLKERVLIIESTRSLPYDILWYNILRIAEREDTDQDRLVRLCKAILEEKDEKTWKGLWKYFDSEVIYHWNSKC